MSSSRIWQLKEKEKHHISIILETAKTQKHHVEEWADELNERIELKDTDEKLPKHPTGISSYIRKELHDRGCSDNQLDYITKILREYNQEYVRDWELGEGVRNSKLEESSLENLVEEYFRLAAVLKNMKYLVPIAQGNVEGFRELDSATHILLDRFHFVAKKLGIALVGHEERSNKISTELPQELETEFYFALFDLYQQSDDFNENILKIAKKVKRFPITDKAINAQRALQTRAFAECFYGLNQRILPSLNDEKYAFSEFEWYKTLVKEEQISKHGAAKKSAIEAVDKDGIPTGVYRPLTREAVTDNKEEVTKDLERALVSFDVFAWLNGLVQWHDIEGQVAQRVAQRRIMLSPKLSETAYGAD